jgi:Protein of unknown function (DUF3298)/Deacetylase PdaC
MIVMAFFTPPVIIQTLVMTLPKVIIYYPRLKSMSNQHIQETINQVIWQKINRLIYNQDYYKNPDNTEMNGSFEIKTNERGILSLSLSNYAYTYHMAHGLTLMESITVNIKTGKFYQLKDLFKKNSNYVQKLSDLIRVQIDQRKIPLLEPFKMIKPNQDYYIADKSLVIYFQLYEITPYYVGFPMFPISVYDIEEIIDENGPLGKMLPNQ